MFRSNLLTVIRYENTDREAKVPKPRAPLHNKSATNREDIILKMRIIKKAQENIRINKIFSSNL
jgi:hypothetical protein